MEYVERNTDAQKDLNILRMDSHRLLVSKLLRHGETLNVLHTTIQTNLVVEIEINAH